MVDVSIGFVKTCVSVAKLVELEQKLQKRQLVRLFFS
jgi:hypothetical protein